MKVRSMLTLAVMAMSLASLNATAHPDGHDDEKEIPKTCEDLKDTKRFTDDSAYPEVKALKARCEARKKESPKKAEAKPPAEKKS